MLKKILAGAVLFLLMLLAETGILHAQELKLSVFNFGTANIEASGLGTSVTNALISNMSRNPSISILDRKDLETFLNMNDLQQNDQLDNVVNIGSRLGLDFIVVGSVAKRGSAITVKCGLIQIDKRKEVYSTHVQAQGESALSAEIAKLASLITSVLTKSGAGRITFAGANTFTGDIDVLAGDLFFSHTNGLPAGYAGTVTLTYEPAWEPAMIAAE